MKAFHLLLVMCSVVGDRASAAPYKRHNPIILVPGMGGNQLEAKLNKSSSDRNCSLVSDWMTVWLSADIIFSPDCFVENSRLFYDPVTRTTYNTPGVEIRVPEFGNTSSVEWLDSTQLYSYMKPLIDHLVRDLGYKRGVSVRAAPYDFRKSPNEKSDYFPAIKNLIEETYLLNNDQPVILIGHSLGNPQILYFLNRQTQEWKKKHIRAFVSISGPYGGSLVALRAMVSGYDLEVNLIDARKIRETERSLTSNAWMLPYDIFWKEEEVLVQGPTRNYTVEDYKALFDDIGFPTGFLMRQDTENLIKDLKAPGVEVHCLYGVNVSTISSLSYDSWDSDPEFSYEDGDGTVPLRSLQGCSRWKEQQTEAVFVKEFEGAQHSEILDNDEVKAYISKLLQK